jgi:hypothetical protein
MRRMVMVIMLTIGLPLAAAEKWAEAYDQGVAAVRAGKYEAGAAALQRAIAEVPGESGALRAGNVIITYVPHFWLGIARYNLGDLDAALREWNTSEEQGAVQKTQYYAQLRQWTSRATTQKTRNSESAAESAAASSRQAANAALSRAVTGQVAALGAGADRSDTYRAAQRKLQEAVDTFNKAGTDVRAYTRAGETAGQAHEMFAAATDEAKRLKAARPPAAAAQKKPEPQKPIVVPVEPPAPQPAVTQPAVTQPATQPAAPQQAANPAPQPQSVAPAPTQPPAPQPAVESEALVSARLALQEYRRHLVEAHADARDAQLLERLLQGKPSDAVIQRVTAEVRKREMALAAATTPRAVTVTAPPTTSAAAAAVDATQLVAAWRAFAGGELDRAEMLLTQLVNANGGANAYLLRGCTRWTRAALARNGDKRPAAEDFGAALSRNHALRLDPGLFSPKLVTFFEALRSAP